MRKFHPFFFIGTIGVIVIAILHMFFALGLSLTNHSVFFALYPTFTSFLIIGVGLTMKQQKVAVISKSNFKKKS